MNHEREGKIQRYKEKKALEAKLKELKSSVDHPSCDDDVARDFYLSTIRKFALTALDEMESLKQEVEILRHIASMPKCGAEAPRPQKSRSVLNNLKILSNSRPNIVGGVHVEGQKVIVWKSILSRHSKLNPSLNWNVLYSS